MAGTTFEHAAEARAALRAIVSDPDLGLAALSSEKVMANLLKDFLPDAPRETAILVAAAGHGVAASLRERMAQGMDAGTAVSLATSSFAEAVPFVPGACEWAVSEIALALGLSLPAGPMAAGAFPRRDGPPPVPVTPEPSFGTPVTHDLSEVTLAPPTPQFAIPSAVAAALPYPDQFRSGSSRKSVKVWAAVTAAVVAVAAVVTAVLLLSHARPKPAAATPSVHIYHLTSGPIGVALAGSHAWISQIGPDKVVEFSTGNGRQVSSDTQDLNFPWAVAAGDGYAWVANDGNNAGSVTKLSMTTGAVTQLAGPASDIANPTAIAVQGPHIWVANLGTRTRTGFTGYGSITELDASTDAVLKTITGGKNGITYPDSIAVGGPYVWVVDGGYKGGLGGVTRIDTRDGSILTKTGGSYGFERPAAIAVSGSHVWVLNNPYRGQLSVTEMNVSDGSWVQTLSGPQYGFGSYVSLFGYRTQGIAVAGNRVWVADPGGGSDGHGAVTEINARTGDLMRVLSGKLYDFYTPNAVTAAGSQVWIASFGPKNTPGSMTVLKSFR